MKRLVAIASICAFLTGCMGSSKSPAPYVHYGQNVPNSKTLQRSGADGMYSVLSGDTLWLISKHYNVSMRDLIEMNGLRSPYMLNVGQRLFIPSPRTYKVREDDNLYRVSRMFSVDMYKLAKANNLGKPYVIKQGDVLNIPTSYRDQSSQTKVAAVVDSRDASGMQIPKAKPAKSGGKQAKMAKAVRKVPKRSSSKFMWPVQGNIVSSYGPKSGGLRNDGINIKASRGANVVAADNGVVVYTGQALEGFGNLILIKHSDRWVTAYAHLGDVTVKKGDVVSRGRLIGHVGTTGSVATPQLHFETRRGTKALNPKIYLN